MLICDTQLINIWLNWHRAEIMFGRYGYHTVPEIEIIFSKLAKSWNHSSSSDCTSTQ